MAAIEPMNQFMIHKVVPIDPVTIGGVTVDLSITNSVMMMLVAAALLCALLWASGRGALVPGRMPADDGAPRHRSAPDDDAFVVEVDLHLSIAGL